MTKKKEIKRLRGTDRKREREKWEKKQGDIKTLKRDSHH